MVIRKKYKFENAHIVRNCYSDRYKYSIHGHSYIVEVFLEANGLDNAGMILDFGVMKNEVGDFIDSFDHAVCIWKEDNDQYVKFMQENSDRHIVMPVSPSAENLSYLMYSFIRAILANTHLDNGEDLIRLKSVRVHETATGYAETFADDLFEEGFPDPYMLIEETEFSYPIRAAWRNSNMITDLGINPFDYNAPEQQV